MISPISMYITNKHYYLQIKNNQPNVQLGGSKQKNSVLSKKYIDNNRDKLKNYNKCGVPNSDGTSNDGCGGRSYE